MRLFPVTVLLFFLFTSSLIAFDQFLRYEPEIVEVSGAIEKGQFQHPNGQWVDFHIISLKKPAEIKADKVNSINISEKQIKEIQLYANSAVVRNDLDKRLHKEATVRGTIFHSHTAWHVRSLVMIVVDVK